MKSRTICLSLAVFLTLGAVAQASLLGNPLISRANASDGATDVLNILSNSPVVVAGQINSFSVFNAEPHAFHGYILHPLGGEQYTVLADVAIDTTGLPIGAVQTFPIGPVNVSPGDLVAHWGPGIPFDDGGIAIYFPSPQPPSSGLFDNSATATNQFIRTYSFGANQNIAQGAGAQIGNPLQAAGAASDGATGVLNVYSASPITGPGSLDRVSIYNQDGPGKAFDFLVLRPSGNSSEYNVIYNSGPLVLGSAANTIDTFLLPDHNGAAAGSISVQAGDLIAHYGQGIAYDLAPNADAIYYGPVPEPAQSSAIILGGGVYPEFAQDRIYRLQANFTAVPEPASWLIAGLALVGLIGVARRK